MYWNKRIQAAKWGYILSSAVLCVLGVILVVVPDFSAVLLCRLTGGAMILFGIVKIVGYFSKDLYRLAFQYDLAFGILLIALGATMLFRPEAMVQMILVTIGVCILADGLLKIQTSIDAKQFGLPKWWLILVMAILTGGAGFLLVLRPTESAGVMMILLGVGLITEGILNLITILTAVKIIGRGQANIVDAMQ